MNLRYQTVKGLTNYFHTYYKNYTLCPFKCKLKPDSQEHLLRCHEIISKLSIKQKADLIEVNCSDLFGATQQQHNAILQKYSNFF